MRTPNLISIISAAIASMARSAHGVERSAFPKAGSPTYRLAPRRWTPFNAFARALTAAGVWDQWRIDRAIARRSRREATRAENLARSAAGYYFAKEQFNPSVSV